MERGYSYLFTDVIRLDEPDWFLRVHTTITDQQNGLVWVSEKVGSAIDDEDSEYDEGNDDRLVKHGVFGDKVTSQIERPLLKLLFAIFLQIYKICLLKLNHFHNSFS